MNRFWTLAAAVFAAFIFQKCQPMEKKAAEPPRVSTEKKLGPSAPDWASRASIYELNVRQFSPEGNFAGVEKQLPRLAEMGVECVWLMPIHPISVKNRKGKLGSPYSVQDYKKTNPDFGTIGDLTRLVEKTHAAGMRLIIDWVPNHTGWDHVWMTERPEVYTLYKGAKTVPLNERGEPIDDWSDVCDLDYSKPQTRSAMIDAMLFWVKTCGIDGFRVDMAGLVPDDFWPEARAAFDQNDAKKPLFLLSEWQDAPRHFEAFNSNYGWKWKDLTKEIASGKKDARHLDSLLAELSAFYPPHFYQIYFTQNHDENSWNGTEKELYGPSADAFTALAHVWQGQPMIYSGQESGLDERLPFFEKKAIDWKNYPRAEFFKTLLALKKKNRALDAGLAGGPLKKLATKNDRQVYAFSRSKGDDRFIGVFNFSAQPQTVELDCRGLEGPMSDVFGRSSREITPTLPVRLGAWEFLLLSNR